MDNKAHIDKILNFFKETEEAIGLPSDTEDKAWYCKYGAEYLEPFFVSLYGPNTELNLPIQINPDKKSNPFTIDFKHTEIENVYMDLKGQSQPFFVSRRKFGINPQYEKTINVQDVIKYKEREEKEGIKIHILIWLTIWDQGYVDEHNSKFDTDVKRMEGLWCTNASEILALPEKRRQVYITYARREINREQEIREKGCSNKTESHVICCTDLKKQAFCNMWDI